MIKKCPACNQDKDESLFNKSKGRLDGLHPYCKECRKIKREQGKEGSALRKKEWYIAHRNLSIQRAIKSSQNRAKQVLEYKKNHYQENENIYKARANKNYYDNHEARKQRMRDWGKSPEGKLYHKNYYRKNIEKFAARFLLRRTLIALKMKKIASTKEMLGYSPDILRQHMEKLWTPGMSWDNYGKWHIDHIRPISSFESSATPREINAIENLRPLWATTRTIGGIVYIGNLNKSDKYQTTEQGDYK